MTSVTKKYLYFSELLELNFLCYLEILLYGLDTPFGDPIRLVKSGRQFIYMIL